MSSGIRYVRNGGVAIAYQVVGDGSSDLVYVSETVRLRAPFVPLGVVPEAASSFMLPLIIGHQRAAEILYTADWIDARRALELGIASRCYPAAELLAAARATAARIAAGPIGAIRHTKRLLLATRAEQVRDRADPRRRGRPPVGPRRAASVPPGCRNPCSG